MSEHKPLITFQPVPVRPRHDGWTIERQIAFVEKLADTNSISAACKHVGMSRESVRKLRRRPGGRAFRDACDAALDCGYADVEQAAMERSKNGVARPIFYKGEQVGEWRHHDERLTMFLLRYRRPHRYGAHLDRFQPPLPVHPPGWEDDGIDPDEAIHSLDFHLEDLVDEAELDAAVDLSAFARPPCDGVNFVNFVGNEDGLDPPEFSREDAKNAKKR